MSCCPYFITPFNNASVTTIDYGPLIQAEYGRRPTVVVYYRDNGELVLSDEMNRVEVTEDSIIVDHGGPASGIVKVF